MTNIINPTSYETFTDFNDKPIQFLLTFLNLGDKYCVSAQEITDDTNHRTFHGYDSEQMEYALTKVRKIVKEELSTKYFTPNFKNPFHELNGDYFRGHVCQNEDGEPVLLVDGKEMTLEDFGDFLKPLDGFRIELKILE